MIKTKEELADYYPGKGCKCAAFDEGECCCNVDWTPREVYKLRLEISQLEPFKNPSEYNGCPCVYTTPCDPHCTCIDPLSSRGCERCCSYGSEEQKEKKAKQLAKIIDESFGV